MNEAKAYAAFLERKRRSVPDHGLANAGDLELNGRLFQFQSDACRWALRKGRAALFLSTGLGKTFVSIEWAKHVHAATGKPVLILAPLAVCAQTVREGDRFGIAVKQVRRADEVDGGIVICNYERLEALDASVFGGVVIDESSILKAFDGKFRTRIIESFARTPYRLACSATPAPNDHVELGNHAEFLGVMSRTEMLSEWFIHDGGDTSKWRLKGHAEAAFWAWVCGWAIVLRSPADLGYDGGSHVLPALNMHEHIVASDVATARKAGMLFAVEARTLTERRDVRRASVGERVAVAAEIVAREPDETWILWGNLNAETDALARAMPGAVQVTGSDDPEEKAARLLDFAEGRIRVLITKPSIAAAGLNLQVCARMAFVGLSDSFEDLFQSIRRCWRFGQTRPVDCHLVVSDAEGAVLRNLQRKEADFNRMIDGMLAHMGEIQRANIKATARMTNEYVPRKPMRVPSWLISEAS